jgi:hypothetical protein
VVSWQIGDTAKTTTPPASRQRVFPETSPHPTINFPSPYAAQFTKIGSKIMNFHPIPSIYIRSQNFLDSTAFLVLEIALVRIDKITATRAPAPLEASPFAGGLSKFFQLAHDKDDRGFGRNTTRTGTVWHCPFFCHHMSTSRRLNVRSAVAFIQSCHAIICLIPVAW